MDRVRCECGSTTRPHPSIAAGECIIIHVISYERVINWPCAVESFVRRLYLRRGVCSRFLSHLNGRGAVSLPSSAVSTHQREREREFFYYNNILSNISLTGFRDWKIRRSIITILLPTTGSCIITRWPRHY